MNLNEYLLLIDKFELKYGLKINKIRVEYEKSIKTMSVEKIKKFTSEYRELIKRMIIELSEIFLSDYSGKVLVALTGSLARKSNTIFSDIDLNFLTNSSINDDIIEIEDKIAYILQQVMKYRGRDKIHTMTVYLPLINNNNFDYIYENKYPLNFKDGTIYYSCRKNVERLMYESYNATRSIYDVVQYLNQNDTSEKLYEWTNCFEILYNKGFENEYFELRHVSKTKINLLFHIDELIEKMLLFTDF